MSSGKKGKPAAAGNPAQPQAQALAGANLEEAKQALAKLPVLGPVIWLCARDPVRKFMFLGDTDWALMPPIVLDQCRLYTRNGIPFAFVTWAKVNDAVDARLRSGQPKIAPHEWNSGSHLWLIDVVAPFGHADETLKEMRETVFPGMAVHALMPEPGKPGQVRVREWPPATAAAKTH